TSNLKRLDGYPHIKVVYRGNVSPDKVALISGGGSGHEPAHAGFVGRGMLSAAVCGEVFASPSVDAVLAGILAVTGDAGCLLIVKNYTGDRLNFGLAAERAKALGKRVEVVVVADDVALPDISQPRGVAGTLFVHKIAGYLAEQGETLQMVATVAREVAEAARSYGVALDNCTVPGMEKDERIAVGMAELGIGIHSEPGVETVAFETAQAISKTIMAALCDGMDKDEQQVLLLNNLGSTTPLEMQVIVDSIMAGDEGQRISALIGPAPLMTSLDMHGFSASLLPARDAWMTALLAPVEPAAWPDILTPGIVNIEPMPEGLVTVAAIASSDNAMRALITDSCAAFIAMEDDLNLLDAKVGDGDTGATLAQAARALSDSVDGLPLADTTALLGAISNQLATTMGGSSGVLLAILFSAAGDASRVGSNPVVALRAGLGRMMEYGGAELGHRTMVDALLPALDSLVHGQPIAEAAALARQGADATAALTRARSGRSAYVPESALTGVTDPGAEGVARYFAMLAARAS
ncbi:MAG: dihydroxyacetone kinase subunit DhaK, partial [Granulosicoccus sp.]